MRTQCGPAYCASSYTRQQIADKLFISMRTVDKYLEKIFVNVDVKCKADLIRRLNGM